MDSADWVNLPKKSLPTNAGSQSVDSAAGWINAVNIQGVIFAADMVSVEHRADGGVRVIMVNDDLRFWAGMRYARVVDIPPLGVDVNLGGAINTLSTQTAYGEQGFLDIALANPSTRTQYKPWKDFEYPPEALRRYGVMLPDELYNSHIDAQSLHGWREWVEHLPDSEIENGRLKSQRDQGRYVKAIGTRTFYHNVAAATIGAYTATNENDLGTSAAGTTDQASGNIGLTGLLVWASATASPSGPDAQHWPSGNYRHQIDCTVTTPDLNFGCLDQDSATGGFARINSARTAELERKQQQESAFSLTGLHLATTGSVGWEAGATSNQVAILITGKKVAGHGNDSMTLQLGETDDFIDGPWDPIDRIHPLNAFAGINS